MPRTPLDPEIEAGLRSMPVHEAIETALKLTASLAAGIAFLGVAHEDAHPINRSFDDMREWLRQKGDVDVVSIDELIQLVERVCFQIWALSAFQPDPVKSQLRELVEPVCGPPSTLVR
jgi:hypothetical protein